MQPASRKGSERRRIPGPFPGPFLIGLAALIAAGCESSAEKRQQTPVEWIRENSSILEQLRSYDRKERQEGIERFLKLGRDQGTAVVNYLLSDSKLEDYRIEVVLARILAKWGGSRAIPKLLSNLRGRDNGAITIAREGLMAFGDNPEILDAMEELIQAPEKASRRTAAEILSEMKGPQALNLLGKRFQVEKDLEIRGICLVGILSSREAGRTEYLINALGDVDSGIRQLAWDALAKKRPPVRFDPDGDSLKRMEAIKNLRRWAQAGKRRAVGQRASNAANG